jgi:hypothetical protein
MKSAQDEYLATLQRRTNWSIIKSVNNPYTQLWIETQGKTVLLSFDLVYA